MRLTQVWARFIVLAPGVMALAILGIAVLALHAGSPPVAEASPSPGRLGLRTDNRSQVQWWNHYATSSDLDFSNAGNGTPVASLSTAGHRGLIYYAQVESLPATIAKAKLYGLSLIIENLEKIPASDCQALVDESVAAGSLIHQAGMRFVFAPTGWLTKRCYQSYPDIFRNADIFFFQAQFLQGKDPTIVADIQTIVRFAKTVKPGIPMWVQLAMTPRNEPGLTPAELESLINTLENGAPGSAPDRIVVFYNNTDQLRMEQVIQTFRTYHP